MKIRITKGKGWYRDEVGEVFEVTGRCKSVDAHYVKVWDDDDDRWVTDSYFVRDGYYEIVGEPKTHIIDGKTFVEVERKANIGEKIIITVGGEGWYEKRVGEIFTVINGYDYGFHNDETYVDHEPSNGKLSFVVQGEYRVLTEVGEEPPAPSNTEDIIANLVRRVHSLERQVDSLSTQLRDTQRNVERQGVEIANLTHKYEFVQAQTSRVDLTTEFIIDDIGVIIKKFNGGGAAK